MVGVTLNQSLVAQENESLVQTRGKRLPTKQNVQVKEKGN